MFRQAATYNVEDITVPRTISIQANEKPGLTKKGQRLLRARNTAFRAGDKVGLRMTRISETKRQYSRRIADHFNDSKDTRKPVVWDPDHHRLATTLLLC